MKEGKQEGKLVEGSNLHVNFQQRSTCKTETGVVRAKWQHRSTWTAFYFLRNTCLWNLPCNLFIPEWHKSFQTWRVSYKNANNACERMHLSYMFDLHCNWRLISCRAGLVKGHGPGIWVGILPISRGELISIYSKESSFFCFTIWIELAQTRKFWSHLLSLSKVTSNLISNSTSPFIP